MRLNAEEEWAYGFHPRKIDPPHAITETREELEELVGSFVGAEQCDGCGNSIYRIIREEWRRDGFIYLAKCALDPTDDPEFQHADPCGAEWPIASYPVSECVF